MCAGLAMYLKQSLQRVCDTFCFDFPTFKKKCVAGRGDLCYGEALDKLQGFIAEVRAVRRPRKLPHVPERARAPCYGFSEAGSENSLIFGC